MANQDMDSERILQLLAKKIGKTASEKELAELHELLVHDPEYHFLSGLIQAIEGEKQHQEPAIEEKQLINESWEMLQAGLERESLKRLSGDDASDSDESTSGKTRLPFLPRHRFPKAFSLKWLTRAAIWMGVVILGAGLIITVRKYKSFRREPMAFVRMKQVSLPYGAPEKRILPDSSIVWLNAGSHISYDADFTRNERDVYLQGEAYFNIRHDAARPFVVHAANIVIKVLGTEFNVQAYSDENTVEATLINGKIQVQIAGNQDKKIILTPNEKLIVINKKYTLTGIDDRKQREMSFQVKEMPPVAAGTDIPELAWVQDKLAFQDEPLGELAKKLERRFNVYIYFDDTLLEKEKLTGVFVNENIQKAIKILQMTTPFRYQIKGDSVYLSR